MQLNDSKKENYKAWMAFQSEVRTCMKNLGLDEVQTPTLVLCPGTEVHLEAFSTQWKHNGNIKNYFLPTSPELHLKRLLCEGWTNIFEFKTCFRNNEISNIHQPEFQMLEWYRAGQNLDSLVEDIENLLGHLWKSSVISSSSAPKIKRVSMAGLFREYLDFNLTPSTSEEELRQLCFSKGLKANFSDWKDLFLWLFVGFIEPRLSPEDILIVHSYPPQFRVLAEESLEGWSERFEVYWRGFEIANAFRELVDPRKNKETMESDIKEREALGFETFPIDEGLIELMYEKSLPNSVGIALGLERLFMACKNLENMSDFLPFAKSWE